MGWLLPLAAGYGEATVARRERERADIAREEQIMLNTMLPIALQNRQQRQADRKKYKEQYNTLTDIVNPDIAQSIMRKGDTFVQGFITKVGDAEQSLGRKITQAELIERGDIKPPMETFGGAPVGYRKIGTDFDTFMNELMGDFQNTDIDTNKVKEGVLLGFGKMPGYEKAMTHSVHRKLAEQLGISPNEVSSLVTGEYDYTDTPDEMLRPKVQMPFVKGEQYYKTQAAELELKNLKEAQDLRVSIVVNGEPKMVTFDQALSFISLEEAILAFERKQTALLITDAQVKAASSTSIKNALKGPLTAMANILGGSYSLDPYTNEGTYTYEGSTAASKLKDISYRAEGILRNHFFNTVVKNPNLEANAQFSDKANLSDPEFLRKVILSSAHNLDPSGYLIKNLVGKYVGSDKDVHYMGGESFSIRDKPSFKRANSMLVSQGYYSPTLVTRQAADQDTDLVGTTWFKAYNTKFQEFKKDVGVIDITARVSKVEDYQTEVIDELEKHLKQEKVVLADFDGDTDTKIREYLDFTGILKDSEMPLKRDLSVVNFKGKSKFEAMQEKIEGLPEFIKDLGVIAETGGVETGGVETGGVETGGKTIGEGDNTGTWSGAVTEDGEPVGVGRITRKDGSTAFGKFDSKGVQVGPWIITEANGDRRKENFPMTEVALESIKQKLDATNTFTNFTIRKFKPSYKHDDVTEKLVGIRAKLRDSYAAYKRGEVSTNSFINTMKELGLAIDEQVEEAWEDPKALPPDVYAGIYKLGGAEHDEYVEDFAKFKKEFNID